jgi:hypothetical protein
MMPRVFRATCSQGQQHPARKNMEETDLAVRVQQPEVGVQLAAVVARELGADGVERDVQRPPVRL